MAGGVSCMTMSMRSEFAADRMLLRMATGLRSAS
jgi:hypothetical protein